MLIDGQAFGEGSGYARLPEELSRRELVVVASLRSNEAERGK
jgi:hypothetical protein